MGERPTVAIRVDESQKEKWQEYVGDTPRFDTLSDLIRTSIAHEMSDEYGRVPNVDSGEVSLSGVETSINKIESQLGEFEEVLESIESGVYSNATTLSDNTLHTVLDRLPYKGGMTTEEVAHADQLTEKRAAMALEVLRADTSVVKRRVTDDGEIVYFRKQDTVPELVNDEPATGPDSTEELDQ